MFGGGGYNIWQVVPRAWSHIFLALINKPIQEGPLPEQWIKKWRAYSPVNLPKHWTEDYRDYQTIPRTYEISQKNNERASRIVHWYTH